MLNNIIPTGYGAGAYSGPGAVRGAKRSGTQAGSFLGLAAQASGRKAAVAASSGLMTGMPVRSAGQAQASGTEGVEAPALKTMLEAKYPGIHYHVFDASGGYWKTRNDYPHYLLYQDGNEAKETLENWQPVGANPFYGSVDGRFIAPKEIKALGNVPPGSKAVVIHPAVQERMERDPAYAQEIYARIDAWFAFDAARNEAVMPGSTVGMSQAVAIGEDGTICNACSSSGGGEITCSQSGSDDGESWWELRMARHAELMKLMVEKQIQRHMQAADLLVASAAKSRLAAMIGGGELRSVLGGEIAGIPTEDILTMTQIQVWGGGMML